MQKIGKKNHQNFKILMTFQYGAPGEIRTPDPLVRSQVLYPTELRVRIQLTLFLNIVRCGGYYTVFILYVKHFFLIYFRF